MASESGSEDTALDLEYAGEELEPQESRQAFDYRSRIRFAAIRTLLESYEDRNPVSYTPEFKFFQLIVPLNAN